MTPEQKVLVQASFEKVKPIANQAAILFYDDLFQRDSKLRFLFKNDMVEQRRKLMQMIETAVTNLDNWDAISKPVRDLGRRHVDYGVKPSDYDTVGAALIATLEKGLGDAFTPEVKQAWIACYTAITAEMLGAPAVN